MGPTTFKDLSMPCLDTENRHKICRTWWLSQSAGHVWWEESHGQDWLLLMGIIPVLGHLRVCSGAPRNWKSGKGSIAECLSLTLGKHTRKKMSFWQTKNEQFWASSGLCFIHATVLHFSTWNIGARPQAILHPLGTVQKITNDFSL